MRRTAPYLLACACLAGAGPLAAAPARAALAADRVPIAAHHALYALSFGASHDGSVAAASGSMSYDMADACNGWTTTQHLQIDMTNRDGQVVKMISDYATFESKDGRRLDFHTRQVTDTAVTEKVDGTATLDGADGSGAVHYTSPEVKTIRLPPGTRLPTTHTAVIIAAATQGQRFVTVPLFDGTGVDGAQDTFVVIENWRDPGKQAQPTLAPLPFGRMHVSFFNRTPSTLTPDYEIGMRYYVNGVADDLAMDFGSFVMNGKLSAFKLAAAARC